MMKYFILFILIYSNSFGQGYSKDESRAIVKKTLNAYFKDNGKYKFNAYEIDYKLIVNFQISAGLNSNDPHLDYEFKNFLKKNSFEYILFFSEKVCEEDYLKNWILGKCGFLTIIYEIEYVTNDYHSIKYIFGVDSNRLSDLCDNFNIGDLKKIIVNTN